LTLGACDADQGRAPRTLVVAQASAIQGLDPAQMTDAESIDLLEQIFEHLVRYAPESMKVEPALATSWEQQADGRTWRFFLRHGVRFHDGTPLTADAVVYSFQRQRTSTPGTETHFPYVNHYRNIVAIEKESSHVVRIVTDRPFAPLLASLAMFPVSIVSPKAFGAAQRGAPLSPVGTGPYKFVSWDRQTGRILLEANRSYWGPRPGMDRLVFVPIPSAAERLSALQSGLVHIARNLPPDMLQLVRLHPDLRLVEAPANNVVYLAMNTERRPFHDPRVRQAVNHAFRKEPFLGLVFQGMASPAVGPLPPSMTPYYTADVQRYDYDPKRARRLLQEAGYDPSLRPKLLVMDAPRSYLPQPRLAASMILRDLQAIGMQIDLQILPFSEQKRQLSLGVHDLGLIGWTGDNGDPDNFLYTLLDSDNAAYGSGLNYAFYREYTFHKLVIAARESLSQAERVRYYHEAQRIAAITCPWVPIGHAKVAVAMRREVRGFRVHPTSVLYLHSVTLR
jgi:peptide/nickel transport system substrate-binding protein